MRVNVDLEIRKRTEGKRALIVGGTGGRELDRRAIETAFGFSVVDWPTGEKGNGTVFKRMLPRLTARHYDLILYMTSFICHKTGSLIKIVKGTGTPIIYVNGGYSIARIQHAIQTQGVR